MPRAGSRHGDLPFRERGDFLPMCDPRQPHDGRPCSTSGVIAS
jgi:hypothetical protein